MVNKKIIIPGFILMVLIQLYVPVKMILMENMILSTGKDFKFKTAPVDPTDVFKGKYIMLSFAVNSAKVENASVWKAGEPVYVSLAEDENGYAKITSLAKEAPVPNEDYVEATINYVIPDTVTWVSINFPFDRFYMEETKASDAERAYRESARDTTKVTYALVKIKNGKALVENVYIENVPIVEYLKNNADPSD